jgi:hypothetical protein
LTDEPGVFFIVGSSVEDPASLWAGKSPWTSYILFLSWNLLSSSPSQPKVAPKAGGRRWKREDKIRREKMSRSLSL